MMARAGGVAEGWARAPERGGAWATRAALWVVLHGGGAAMAWVGTGWFLLTSRAARGASREYLGRALGRKAGVREVARHFHAFALAVVDRVLLLAGREEGFTIRTEGLDVVLDLVARGQGCVLLGAHLGSFEVLRVVARQSPVPVWALMYRRNGGALMALLDRLAPGVRARVLEVGDTASMIRARECVERGEMVGMLADRMPDGSAHRVVGARFLGAVAGFPSGPFVLAAALGAPVVLFHAVRVGRRTYAVRFEAFSDRVVLRRGARGADLRLVVGRYAAAVERACRAHPYQWFNFFPFWQGGADAGLETDGRAAGDGAGGGAGRG